MDAEQQVLRAVLSHLTLHCLVSGGKDGWAFKVFLFQGAVSDLTWDDSFSLLTLLLGRLRIQLNVTSPNPLNQTVLINQLLLQ